MIFLNLLGYYTEFFPLFKKPNNPLQANSEPINLKDLFKENINPTIETIIKDLHNTNKPLLTLGYGVIMLFHAFEKNEWIFNKFNLTGISINEECREAYFPHLPFLIEESVQELGGYFMSQSNPTQAFVTVDKNLVCGQNDNSLMIGINNFCFLITKQFLFNL